MDTAITIRAARAEDIGDILAVENGSFDGDRFSRAQFAYLVNRAKGAFYVAIIDDKIAGYICLLSHSARANLRIYSIAILPGYRGCGIAGALVAKAKEFAVAEGKSSVSLEVRTDNLSAIRLYEKHGFHISSTIKQYYHDLADAFRMVLPIN